MASNQLVYIYIYFFSFMLPSLLIGCLTLQYGNMRPSQPITQGGSRGVLSTKERSCELIMHIFQRAGCGGYFQVWTRSLWSRKELIFVYLPGKNLVSWFSPITLSWFCAGPTDLVFFFCLQLFSCFDDRRYGCFCILKLFF